MTRPQFDYQDPRDSVVEYREQGKSEVYPCRILPGLAWASFYEEAEPGPDSYNDSIRMSQALLKRTIHHIEGA
jgi:hypothetical protein